MRHLSIAVVSLSLIVAPRVQGQGLDALQAKTQTLYTRTMGEILPNLAYGQAKILEASGKKDEAAKMRAAGDKAKAASTKADAGEFNSASVVISPDAKKISGMEADSAVKLDKASTPLFIDGARSYVVGEMGLKDESADLAALPDLIAGATKGLNPFAMVKAKSTVNLAKALESGIPQILAKSVDGLTAIRAFAASRKLEMPADLLSEK